MNPLQGCTFSSGVAPPTHFSNFHKDEFAYPEWRGEILSGERHEHTVIPDVVVGQTDGETHANWGNTDLQQRQS